MPLIFVWETWKLSDKSDGQRSVCNACSGAADRYYDDGMVVVREKCAEKLAFPLWGQHLENGWRAL